MAPVPVCYFPTRRQFARTFEPGAIERLEAFGDASVEVLDVSAGGARLCTRRPVHVSEKHHVRLQDRRGEWVRLLLRVVWQHGDQVGVALERPSAWWDAMVALALR